MSRPTVLDQVKQGQDEFNKERAKASDKQVNFNNL